jgi:hypothetical protein
MAAKIQKSSRFGFQVDFDVGLDYHGNGRHFEFVQPPKAATYYGGFSYKVDHNMAPKPWILIPNIKIYLETKSGGFLYFGGHFGCCELIFIVGLLWRFKMTAIIQNPPIWAKFGFQVDYDVAN